MSEQITMLHFNSPEVRDALAEILRPVLKEEFSLALKQSNIQQPDTTLSRKDTAKLLGVCPATLTKLYNKGAVNGSRVGSKMMFLRSDIETFLKAKSGGKS